MPLPEGGKAGSGEDPEVRILYRGLEPGPRIQGSNSGHSLRGLSRRRYFFLANFPVALLIMSLLGISIENHRGEPVAGASVCTDTVLVGTSDRRGVAAIPEGLDSVLVRAIGYLDWEGPVPSSGTIRLRPVTVPSGMVVTVSARRGTLRDRFPATTTLGPDEMKVLGRSGLRRLMALSGGVFVREYGGSMPVVSISIRGSDPAHSKYLVDGHDISSSMDGYPGLTLDPLVFGGMEIARGSGSSYSSGGMAGTLNLLPTSPAAPPGASLSGGSDGSGRLFGSLPWKSSRLALSLRRSRGTGGTTGYSGTFLLNGIRSRTAYGLLASLSAGETESPSWSLPTDGRRERGSIDGWGRLVLGGVRLSSGFRLGRQNYRSTVPEDTDDTHDEAGAGLEAEIRGTAAGLDMRLSTGMHLDGVRSTSIGTRNITEFRSSLEAGISSGVSAGASVALSFVPGREILHGAGVMLGAPLGDSLIIAHAGASLGFRRPTLNDLYWPEDSFARGNPDLGPETSAEVEAGFSVGAGHSMSLSLTGFTGESSNLIRWEPEAGGIWTPVNTARVLRRGMEVETRAGSGPLEISSALTLLDVRDNDPGSVNFGRTLPYVPDCTWSAGAVLRFPRTWVWSLGAEGTGIRFMNYSETSWMKAYSIVSAGVTVRPAFLEGVSLDIFADNLLDEKYMETSGFEGRGRVFHFGLGWSGEQ